jgi:hypothetical protein
MEYTIKLKDQTITWYVTFRDRVIIRIDNGQKVYTPEHHMFQHAKRYAEDLIIEQINV